MQNLIVYFKSIKVGILRQDSSGLMQFRYVSDWLHNPSAIPLSRSLPLQEEEFNGKQTRPFFAGILPEETIREIISRTLGISKNNDFALLKAIGGECAGAISLFPEGTSPTDFTESLHHQLSEFELEEIIQELPSCPLMAGKKGIRLSLAGAQDKLPVIVEEKNFYLPLGNTPSTHILKPEPDRFPGLAVNEFFCMNLARAIGILTPDTELRKIGKKECLLIKRFDRHINVSGRTERIHQEDFCQALGFPPEQKYQQEGGATLQDSISLLRDWSTIPVLDIPAFLNVLIFNILIGNADAHSKNFSFLYSGNTRRLAPFYDLVSTICWPELSKNLAMKIGGSESVNAFNMGNWRKMANHCEISWPVLRERLVESCQKININIPKVSSLAEEYQKSLAVKLKNSVQERAEKLKKVLASQGI